MDYGADKMTGCVGVAVELQEILVSNCHIRQPYRRPTPYWLVEDVYSIVYKQANNLDNNQPRK